MCNVSVKIIVNNCKPLLSRKKIFINIKILVLNGCVIIIIIIIIIIIFIEGGQLAKAVFSGALTGLEIKKNVWSQICD